MKEPIEGATCPYCQGQLYRTDRFVICENQGREADDCHFIMRSKTSKGKLIPDKDILKLCEGETVGPYTFLSKPKEGQKKGSEFKTWLKFDPESGEVKYVFDPSAHDTEYKCPNCGKTLEYRTGKYGPYLTCPGRDFHMSLEYCQHKFSDDEIRKLLNGETIYADDFISRKGNNFAANVSIDFSSGRMQMTFSNN